MDTSSEPGSASFTSYEVNEPQKIQPGYEEYC